MRAGLVLAALVECLGGLLLSLVLSLLSVVHVESLGLEESVALGSGETGDDFLGLLVL